MFGEQVYSLYARESLIKFYNKIYTSSINDLNNQKNELEKDSNNQLAKSIISHVKLRINHFNNILSVLNGTMFEMNDSYLNVSEIGHRL